MTDGRLMEIILIATNSGVFGDGESNTKSTKLSLLKFLPLAYHHSNFLAATLDFTSFFHNGPSSKLHTFYYFG